MDTQAQTITQAQANALAEQVGKTMYAVDTATKDTMGITLQECAPGRATMRMEVKPLAFEWPPNLPWRFYFYAGRFHICICVQQLQQSGSGCRLQH